MMKNYLIYILILSGFLRIPAQEVNITPPSPDSFSFVNSIDEDEDFTGSAKISIPLLTLSNNRLSESVSLLYNTAGVKVDDLPSDVGISWILKTGGVVTRTVYGIADERSTHRMYYDEATLKGLLQSDCTSNEFIRNVLYQPEVYDSEKDIFRFNVGNISGSFTLDENLNPKFIQNNSNVRIRLLTEDNIPTSNYLFNGFEVTTSDGVKYLFGGNGYVELTKAVLANPHNTERIPTSFYLRKIIHPNGDSISYTYENTDLIIYETNIVENQSYIYESSQGMNENKSNHIHQPEQWISTEHAQELHVKNKKRILQISGSGCNCNIEFLYHTNTYDKYLSEVRYKKDGLLLEKVSFSYQQDPNSIRFFLNRADYYKNNNYDKSFKMDYYDPMDLPPRLSKAQDLFGYYNGVLSNSTLLAKPYTPFIPIVWVADTNNFGDRKPVFEYAMLGSLKKVTYPTGGSIEYKYEAPKAFDIEKNAYTGNMLHIGSPNTPHNIPYKEVFIHDVLMDQDVEIQITGMSDTAVPHNCILKVIDLSTGSTVHQTGHTVYKRPLIIIPPTVSTMHLQEGKSYKITLEFSGGVPPHYAIGFVADVGEIQTLKLEDYLGVRVKSKTEVSETGVKTYKRYYYRPTEFYQNEKIYITEQFRIEPVYSRAFLLSMQGPNFDDMQSDNFTTESNNPIFMDYGFKRRYDVVSCSIGGDHYENGGYEKHFKINRSVDAERIKPDAGPGDGILASATGMLPFENTGYGHQTMLGIIYQHYYIPTNSNRNDFDGNITKIKYFKNTNGNIYKIRQDNNQYHYDFKETYVNLKKSMVMLDLNQTDCLGNGHFIQRIAHFYLVLYKWFNIQNKIRKSTTIEYKTPVLLNESFPSYLDYFQAEVNDTNTDGILTTKEYFYNPANDDILSETKETFASGEQMTTTYQYAYDKNNQFLIDRHFIGVPLLTEVKRTAGGVTQTISKTEDLYPATLYEANNKTGGLPLPYSKISYDLESGSSREEITLDHYDQKGNLMQYTTKDGVPVTIIWGYHQSQPIIKIKGTPYNRPIMDNTVISAAVAASDTDADQSPNNDESTLLTALDNVRKDLSQFEVTTYTYDPMIGIRSITPPSGIRDSYIYDSANRLEKIVDANGKILKELQYHYKP